MNSRSKVHSVQSCSIVCAARCVTGVAIAWRCSCYRQLEFGMALQLRSPVVTICTACGHYMYRQWSLYVPPVVTICTASGHYMYRQWSLYVPPVVTICTACGHYMYRQFNIQQFYVLPTHCIYVFWVDLRTNSYYFPIQH